MCHLSPRCQDADQNSGWPNELSVLVPVRKNPPENSHGEERGGNWVEISDAGIQMSAGLLISANFGLTLA